MSRKNEISDVKIPTCMGLGFAAIGIFFIIGSWSHYRDTTTFLKTAITTQGTVIEGTVIEGTVIKARETNPTIQFKTKDGRNIIFNDTHNRSRSSKFKEVYSTGSQVSIIYQPNHPENARINTFYQLWFDLLISAFVGAIFTISGITLLIKLAKG